MSVRIMQQSGVVQLYVRLPTAESQTPDIVRALSRVMVSARSTGAAATWNSRGIADDASVLVYVEDWEDRDQLERRIRSDRFGALLGLMEACPAAPQLELGSCRRCRGSTTWHRSARCNDAGAAGRRALASAAPRREESWDIDRNTTCS